MRKLKFITLAIVSLGVFTNVSAQKHNDGVDAEVAVSSKKSKELIDKSQGFLNRGEVGYTVPKDLKDGIKVGDAKKLGLDIQPLVATLNSIEKDNQIYKGKIDSGTPERKLKKQGSVDSFLLYTDGKLVLEEYFGYARQEIPHYQMSITKSITSYAIGIAKDQGKIESVEDPVLKYLPEIDPSKLSENTKKIKIKDALTMRSGIKLSKEDFDMRKIDVSKLTEEVLVHSKTLEPGTVYKYKGEDPNMMVKILKNTTGYNMIDFVDEYLFGPMGITNYSFGIGPNGLTKAAAGMTLRSRDMLKVGMLCLNEGEYNGKRILSKEWVNAANGDHVDNGDNKYGYFWWTHYITYKGKEYEINSCRGAGGQFIFSVPDLNTVAVFTSYGSRRPFEFLEEVVIPVVADTK